MSCGRNEGKEIVSCEIMSIWRRQIITEPRVLIIIDEAAEVLTQVLGKEDAVWTRFKSVEVIKPTMSQGNTQVAWLLKSSLLLNICDIVRPESNYPMQTLATLCTYWET